MAIIRKITYGFVDQKFDTDTGEFISQDFIAGDQVEFEDKNGDSVDPFDDYLAFDMVQPS
jgi:hypothetical protein